MKAGSKRKPAGRKASAAKPAGGKPGRRAPAPAQPVSMAAEASVSAAPAASVAPASSGIKAAAAALDMPVVDLGVARRAGLRLESSCTLRDAMDMQFQLLAVDFGDSEICIDGSAVERIDTAGLQMLVAFAKYHAARGRDIQWTAASPELLRSSRLLGLVDTLGLAAVSGSGEAGGH